MREKNENLCIGFYCSFKNCFIIYKDPNQYNEEHICLNSGMHYWTGLEIYETNLCSKICDKTCEKCFGLSDVFDL